MLGAALAENDEDDWFHQLYLHMEVLPLVPRRTAHLDYEILSGGDAKGATPEGAVATRRGLDLQKLLAPARRPVERDLRLR